MKNNMDFDSLTRSRDEEIKQVKKKLRDAGEQNEFLSETHYLYSLLEITRLINTPQDFNQVLERIVDSAITITRAERGFLMLYHEDGNLEFKVTRNIDQETLKDEEFEISKTIVNQVLATNKSLFLSDIYKDKKFKISESIEMLGLRMIMCVPLKTKEHLWGIIYVDSHSEVEGFTQLQKKIFEAFAAQASIAIENSHLYDVSVHDALTGLYNYAYLRVCLEAEITRALRGKREDISFIMFDLDKFKSINDSYGHLFGNKVLVKVAEIIKRSVRKYDIAARYGGDEFAILLPDSNVRDAQFLAERLQNEITKLKFSVGKDTFSISLSIGISNFPADQIINSENIIIEADHAMFVAKNKGGNQIAIFGLKKEKEKREPTFLGKSKAIVEVRGLISKFAKTEATVLIAGETGTGKELITQLVHRQSGRAKNPLVVVNCGAIPDNLLETELFGYERGAFTGAYKQHKGKFEVANGGTIFLDEIGELPLHLQVKLLRAIEQKEIDRIGGKLPIKVDVRVIAATNKNLESEVKKGNFRKDLFYRLSVATIYVPPLRERPDDIDILSDYYLNQMNIRYHRRFLGFTKLAKASMMNHHWSGNVRELIHRIERAVIMGRDEYLDENDLGLRTIEFKDTKPLRELRDKAEMEGIMNALMKHRWNITRASKTLGISQKALRHLMKKHKLVKPNTIK
jgi:diguanylate cyclase (GGDEF)-like protein